MGCKARQVLKFLGRFGASEPPHLPLPQKHPKLRPWVFPSPETRTMVWVSPFPGKYRVWGGLGFGPSFSGTMVRVSTRELRNTGVGVDKSGKEGFGVKNSHFPLPRKRALWAKKSPFLYRAPKGKWRCFPCRGRTRSQVFLGKLGVFFGKKFGSTFRGTSFCTLSGCRKRSAAKGVRSLFFVFGTLSVTFRSLFLMLLSHFSSLFYQTPFAGHLLRQGDLIWPDESGWTSPSREPTPPLY